ncbi:MAG: transposase, partial [Candidatus Methanoperedens sp.]|nr:transposase [Candidatus Methanoperedens nitroreducens]MCX9078403.1 transposase [Candidatus Methanoperedens sp.]
HTKKTVKSQFGKIELEIPRDADREHEPIIVKKHERTLSSDLEGMIVSLFTSGMSNKDIGSHMNKIYGLDVSPEMVTRITDKILPLAKEWQSRPLNEMYPIIYLDGIVFNVNKDGQIVKKTAYVVFAVTIEGKKDILGIWMANRNHPNSGWVFLLT